MGHSAKQTRRGFLGLLGAGIGTTLVVACSSSPPAAQPTAANAAPTAPVTSAKPAASTATAQPAAKAAPAPAGTESLAFWSMPLAGGTDWQKWLGDITTSYASAHPNLKIEPLYMTWDLIQKVITSIAGGSPPDLFGRGSFNYLFYALKAGVALEVNLPAEFQKDLPTGYYDAMHFKGKNYFIPWFVAASGSRINLTLIKSAKAESLLPKQPAESWTWDQWLSLMKATTGKGANGKQSWGTALFTQTKTPAYHWQTWQYLWNQGIDMFKNPQEGGCIGLNSEAGIKALQFLHDLYTVDKVVPNPASVRDTDIGTYWNQGSLTYQVGGGNVSGAQAKGETVDKKTMIITDSHGFEWQIVQNPTAAGVQEQCWGGPGIDVHLQPFKQKTDARAQAVVDFGLFLSNPANQAGMAPFEIPVRTSVVKDKLSDNPIAQYTAQYLVPGAHGWFPDGNAQKLLDIFNTHFQELFLGKSPAQVANEFTAEANGVTGCKS